MNLHVLCLFVNILYIQASSTQILKEFKHVQLQRNTATDYIEDLLTSGLQKYRKAIIKVLSKKKKTTFLKEIEDASVHYRTESQRNYAEDCIILAGIPLLFKEKPENVLIWGQDQKDYPMSMNTDIFQVFVEETHIFKCDNFFEAFCGLLACIYVMNLAYPKTLEKTFTFVQNILIGLKDNEGQVSIDRRIVAVLSSINAELDK